MFWHAIAHSWPTSSIFTDIRRFAPAALWLLKIRFLPKPAFLIGHAMIVYRFSVNRLAVTLAFTDFARENSSLPGETQTILNHSDIYAFHSNIYAIEL